MNTRQFNDNPRVYALELVDYGLVSAEALLLATLNYMSHSEIQDMLDNEELSPRFEEDEE